MNTEERLVKMLTENTGTHFLDSGGAYGRNWERNAGMVSVEAWNGVAPIVMDDYGSVTLNLFHFLKDRLEYEEDMANRLSAFETLLDSLDGTEIVIDGERLDSDYSWMDLVRYFPHWLRTQLPDSDIDYVYGANTYNNEDALSQVIQYDVWEIDRDPYVILQIHGGCDVRGGYTQPEIFRLTGEEYDLGDNARAEAVLEPYIPEVTDIPLPLAIDPVPIPESEWWSTYDAGYSWESSEGGSYKFIVLSDVDIDYPAEHLANDIRQGIYESLEGRPSWEKNDRSDYIFLVRHKDEARNGGQSPNVFDGYDADSKKLGTVSFYPSSW